MSKKYLIGLDVGTSGPICRDLAGRELGWDGWERGCGVLA